MTSGNPWDGSAISYTPPPRMQRRTGLVAAGVLILTGMALLIGAVIGQQLQSPVRNNGDIAVGTVLSVDDGWVSVGFGVGDEFTVVEKRGQVSGPSGISAGTVVTVRFDPGDPTVTFVERIDVLEPLTPLLLIGSGFLGLGLLFARFPPRSPERVRKV
ncbi:hypothetical protein [Rhodoglobus aureus]|uniref:DUF3592 domain-containing protein n=1 Tax=Rhodoglobus aureus TaxID=191497 RepID=A0ABN1VPB8_9MICO